MVTNDAFTSTFKISRRIKFASDWICNYPRFNNIDVLDSSFENKCLILRSHTHTHKKSLYLPPPACIYQLTRNFTVAFFFLSLSLIPFLLFRFSSATLAVEFNRINTEPRANVCLASTPRLFSNSTNVSAGMPRQSYYIHAYIHLLHFRPDERTC